MISVTSVISVIVILGLGIGLSANKSETVRLVDRNTQVEETEESDLRQEETDVENSDGKETQKDEVVSTTFYVGDAIETEDLIIQYLSCEDYVSDSMFIKPKDI